MSEGAGNRSISSGNVAHSILITGDHNVINGIAFLPTDYGARIHNFVFAYTGTKDRPVPFGGRERELEKLSQWLADSEAPPYLFVGAPAGRGKSALLVRWLERVQGGEEPPALVFVPVSVRFNTNLASTVFAALAARLAYLHGEKVPTTGSNSVDIWRGMVSNYLRRPLPDGRRLLVVLDGLDEAADWNASADLFPLDPPESLRVVVSARYQANETGAEAWLGRLGWDRNGLARTLDLGTLDTGGIRDVLQRMGFPLAELGQRVDIVAELHRLTGGDPLLIRLYVDDLWQRGPDAVRLQPEDLRELSPGYEGFFNKWWEDQRRLWGGGAPLKERPVQTVLNILACALGPLQIGDIQELAAKEDLTTWDLKEALRTLTRFVIGDGEDEGYVFQHPKLAEYFRDQLSLGDREAWETRFLDWGRRTLEALENGACKPAAVSPYLVRHYGAHLQRMGRSCYALVCEGWLRAWEALEGMYLGFLNDVDRAWAEAEKQRDIAMQIRCALCHASVRALSANIPPGLLAQAVKEGLLTPAQGLAYIRQTPDSWQQAFALAQLSPYLPETMLREAFEVAHANEEEGHRAEALTGLAPYLPESLLREALEVARAMEEEFYRARALIALAPHFPQKERQEVLSEALEVARGSEDEGRRTRALAALAPHLPELLLREALNFALAIEKEFPRAKALVGIVPHLSGKKRREVLKEAFKAARGIEDKCYRVGALTELAPHIPEEKRQEVLREALLIVSEIENDIWRAEALALLVPYLQEQEREEALFEAVSIFRDLMINGSFCNVFWTNNKEEFEWYYAGFLFSISTHLRDGLLNLVLEETRRMEYKPARAKALAALLPNMPGQKRGEVLSEAFEIAREIESHWYYGEFVALLTPFLPENNRKVVLSKAIKVARKKGDDLPASRLLGTLAPYCSEFTLFEVLEDTREKGAEEAIVEVLSALAPHLRGKLLIEAFEMACGIKIESLRAKALSNLARFLSEPSLSEALVIAREIKDAEARAKVLTAILTQLTETNRSEVLSEALMATREIGNRYPRAKALLALSEFLPDEESQKIWLEVLRIVSEIEDELSRSSTLNFLALELPKDKRKFFLNKSGLSQEINKGHTSPEEMAKLTLRLAGPSLSAALGMVGKIAMPRDRGKALIALVQQIPGKRYQEVMSEVLKIALDLNPHSPNEEDHPVKTLSSLIPYLKEWAKDQSEKAMQEARTMLRRFASNPRPDFLKYLQVLLPFFLELIPESDRQNAAERIYHSIRDVWRWWP